MFDFLLPPTKADGFIRWLIVFFAVLWLLWFMFGGRERVEENAGRPYIKPAAPLDSGEKYRTR